MGRKIDMIGNKFGKLLVLEQCEDKTNGKKIRYRCLCDCGKTKDVPGMNLRMGKTKSCGCISEGHITDTLEIGDRFGKFIVISKEFFKDSSGTKCVLCECDCGTQKYVNSYNLITGKSTECGCSRGRSNVDYSNRFSSKNFMDEVGKTYSMMYIEEYSGKNKNSKHIYKCRCLVCGRFVIEEGTRLRAKESACCGCISHPEARILSVINKFNCEVYMEHPIKVVSYQGELLNLRFDFYIPQLNLIIEYDGEHHYKDIKYFGGYAKYQFIRKSDQLKNEYCYNNHINLVRIPYILDKNLEEVAVNIISHYTNNQFQNIYFQLGLINPIIINNHAERLNEETSLGLINPIVIHER